MTDMFYITESLVYDFSNKSIKYQDKKINHRNWLNYFSDYGYTNMPDIWLERLGKNSTKMGILDCGSNGDCLFFSISEALNFENQKRGICDYHTVESLRTLVANAINKNNFELILESYKLEYESFDFNGDWNPFEIKTIKQLKNEIIKGGDNFWGDMILIQLLIDTLKTNIIILRSDTSKIYPLMHDIKKYNKSIILYYNDDIHFQLVGIYSGNSLNTVHHRLPQFFYEIYYTDTNSLE